MPTMDFINAVLFVFGMLFAFVAGRLAERRYWVNRTWKESDYRD